MKNMLMAGALSMLILGSCSKPSEPNTGVTWHEAIGDDLTLYPLQANNNGLETATGKALIGNTSAEYGLLYGDTMYEVDAFSGSAELSLYLHIAPDTLRGISVASQGLRHDTALALFWK